MTAYALTFAGLMLFFGRMAGLLLFVVSSLICGLAWSAAVLVAARAIQGVSAAIMAPTALSIVVSSFPDSAERNKALGIWGGLGGFGATAGLLLGGVITSLFGWEWVFFINVPIGLVVLALCPVLIGESRAAANHHRFDFVGAVTITAAPLLIAFAVIQAPEVGWGSMITIGSFAAAAGALVLFVVAEARSSTPLVPLRIFRNRTLVGGNLLMLTVGLAVDGMLFPLTLYAQQVLGYTAMQFGLMSAVMTGMSIVGAFAGQALATKVGVRPIAIGGTLLVITGSLLLVPVSASGSFLGDMLWGLLVFGPGLGACFVAAQISALADVPEAESGLAAGLVDTLFNIGSALGIAIVTSVVVAVSRTVEETAAPQAALNDGLRAGFGVAAVFGTLGLAAALFILKRGASSTSDVEEYPSTATVSSESKTT